MGGGSKPPRAALAEDRCGERRGKRRREWRQVGIGKTVRSPGDGIAVEVSLEGLRDVETGARGVFRDEPGGCPLIGRVASGMKAT